MRKIPSLFKRDYKMHKIYDKITEGCEWVIKGEGVCKIKLKDFGIKRKGR